MRARQIGVSRVIQVPSSTSLHDAARTMKMHGVGCLVVVSVEPERAIPVGIVTDRDLATRALGTKLDPDMATVDDVMSAPVIHCPPDATVGEIVSIMRGACVRRLPIVDAEGALVGIVCADDVWIAMTELMAELTQAMSLDPLAIEVCD